MAKPKYDNIKLGTVVTPKGTATTCYITTPSKTFNTDGEYVAKLEFDPKDKRAKEFIKELQGYVSKAKKELTQKYSKLSGKLVSEDDIPFGTNDNGKLYINAKQRATITVNGKKKDITLVLRDAKRELVDPQDIDASKGSVLKLAIDVIAYANAKGRIGISFRLREVMVLAAIPYTPTSAFSSDDEEEGYEIDECEEDDDDDTDDDDSDDDDDDCDDDDDDCDDDDSDDDDDEDDEESEDDDDDEEVEEKKAPPKSKGKSAPPKKEEKKAAPPAKGKSKSAPKKEEPKEEVKEEKKAPPKADKKADNKKSAPPKKETKPVADEDDEDDSDYDDDADF